VSGARVSETALVTDHERRASGRKSNFKKPPASIIRERISPKMSLKRR
jgi:hypothetical protein